MIVNFTPIHVADRSKKRRANAKAPSVTKILHFHEDFTLRDVLSKILTQIKGERLIAHSWLFRGQELDEPDSFSMSYTIPRRVTEQITINEESDYHEMIEEATKKTAAEVKVYIVELKVRYIISILGLFQLTFLAYRQNEDELEEELEHEEAPASKKKKACTH